MLEITYVLGPCTVQQHPYDDTVILVNKIQEYMTAGPRIAACDRKTLLPKCLSMLPELPGLSHVMTGARIAMNCNATRQTAQSSHA